ncbi:Cytochrome P450 monooxygenase mpaDE [Lasiodiplodia hormozganensis]|uniref:Cytochrome P450 monooxygenase mpaDE n=1 Tax=Lasiodiplodia hormozganensis TaxID=869390 RepID=A0AA40CIE5_9PEZI|nr:Cytochrome P450 monooxygenase mpaDE [Lasiodiplodia hormozganensis]
MAATGFLSTILTTAQRHPFLLLFLLLTAYLLHNRYQRNLHHIPGPWLRSISTLPRMYSVYRGHSHDDDLALHRQYGSVVRIAPNLVSISDPRAIPQIYGPASAFRKSRFYELSAVHDDEGLVPDTFVLADRALHARMKRNAAAAYSMNALVRMEPWLEGPTGRLLGLLDEAAASGRKCDLGELLRRYAMDAVFCLTFGRDLDFLRKGDRTGMLKTLDVFTDYMAIFGQVPWTHRFLLGNATVANWFLGAGAASQDEMMALAQDQVRQYRSSSSSSSSSPPSSSADADAEMKPTTFLHRLLHTQQTNPSSLTDREIHTHAFGNITAGSDTTSTALRAVLLCLLGHPAAYARLRDELEAEFGDVDFNCDGRGHANVTFARANALPYLRAVIREAMRLHPSVGMLLGRVAADNSGTMTICGVRVPAGTEVGVNPWVVQRDARVYAEPDAFVPERWLSKSGDGEEEEGGDEAEKDGEKDRLRAMNASFFAFGAGPHTCSGRWMALLEITTLVPVLVLRYDFELWQKGRGVGFRNRWFTQQWGVEVVVRRRSGGGEAEG